MQYVFTQPEHRQAAVLAVSSFDGVHSRHQQLLSECVSNARRLDAAPVALLPWPSSADDPPCDGILTTLNERLALIGRIAPAVQPVVLVANAAEPWSPTTLFERMCTGWDVRDILLDPLSEQSYCGTELAEAARQRQVPVTAIGHDETAAVPMEARIRSAIVEGRVAEAAQHLTYDYALSAEVVGGDRRGRLLGFPTANLRVDAGKVIPANGIYAVRVALPGDDKALRPAVASVGVRPTFGEGNVRLVEVHLLDLNINLYGVRIETAFGEWLRPEERFATVEALIRQMNADVAQARQRLAPSSLARSTTASEGRDHSSRVAPSDDAHP